jgi:hypothetical protein
MGQIKLTRIQEEMLAYNTKKKFYLTSDEYIEMYTKFQNEKIKELILDLIDFINVSKKENIYEIKKDVDVIIVANFFIIKHFTSLYDELNGKSTEVHFATMMELINIGWYADIISEFETKEMDKVMRVLYNSVDFINNISTALVEKDGK